MMAYLIKKLNLFYISTSEHATTYIGLLDTLKYEEEKMSFSAQYLAVMLQAKILYKLKTVSDRRAKVVAFAQLGIYWTVSYIIYTYMYV